MEITVNLLEVASELANQIVHSRFLDDESFIYKEVANGDTVYTDHAQSLFNEWYDYYYDFLWDLKTDEL